MICPSCGGSETRATMDPLRHVNYYRCGCGYRWTVSDEDFVRLLTEGWIARGIFEKPDPLVRSERIALKRVK